MERGVSDTVEWTVSELFSIIRNNNYFYFPVSLILN